MARAAAKTAHHCQRCGGFMVLEVLPEISVDAVGWRCVMCGEHIDPLILEHRRKMQTMGWVRDIWAPSGKALVD